MTVPQVDQFRFTFVCVNCHQTREGVFFFDVLTLYDSHGGVLEEGGMICHVCLREPFEGFQI